MAQVLTIITLNIWGIPYVSLDRKIRINAIGDELASGKYDVVSLQEVWSENDYKLIKQKTEKVLPHAYYFYSGVAGSGLCVLSKFPIVSVFFHAWSVNGYVHRIQHGDWFGGKGVGLCRILVNNKTVNIYATHLHAEYDNENDEYKAHRVIQAFDTAQFIENTRGDAVLQVLAGDLNTEPHDISYRVLMQSAKLADCYKRKIPIGTNECSKNSYTTASAAASNPTGKRIDHLLIREGHKYEAVIEDYALPLPDRVPGQSFSYSDHEAVSVRISINNKNHLNKESPNDDVCNAEQLNGKYETIKVLQECVEICNISLNKLGNDRIFYFTMAFFVAFLLFAMIDLLPPYGLKTLYLLLKFILSGIIIFFIFMATLWNIIERHGILSGKLSMEIALKNIELYS